MLLLTKGQDKAVKKLVNWWLTQYKQVYRITGSAGTGKTTVVYSLIDAIGLNLKDVLFVSYVGKATLPLRKRGLAAKTIHSACYVREEEIVHDENGNPIILPTGRYKKSAKFVLRDRLPKHIKLIVIDEAENWLYIAVM